MIKITYPYNDQLNQFSFDTAAPIRLQFCTDNISSQVQFVVYAKDTSALKQFQFNLNDSPRAVPLYIDDDILDNVTDSWYKILIEFDRVGFGYETLDDLDRATFIGIDYLRLNAIVEKFADWISVCNSTAQTSSAFPVEADNDLLSLLCKSVNISGDIMLEAKGGDIGLSDLHSFAYRLLGEVDPELLIDIDAVIAVFERRTNMSAESKIAMSADGVGHQLQQGTVRIDISENIDT